MITSITQAYENDTDAWGRRGGWVGSGRRLDVNRG